MKRLFVAVKVVPDQQFVSNYLEFRRKLVLNRITWVEPSVMHITLKFLGPTPNESIPHIHTILYKVFSQFAPFEVHLDHLGIFGSSYQPKVVWLGTSNPEPLAQLGHAVINGLHEGGFLKDRQNFVPHLSLGRIKSLENKKYFQKVVDEFRFSFQQTINIREAFLYRSILLPAGPMYQQISNFNLTRPV